MHLTPPVIDLHCDLLTYLYKTETRTPFDDQSRCSLNLMSKGNLKLQVLALFSETEAGSTDHGTKQLLAFEKTKKNFQEKAIAYIPAVENASCFFEEAEPLQLGFDRLNNALIKHGPFLYLSLTWNHENRFGGGNKTEIGLKKDGEHLLDFLADKKIAIDMSHTSDLLAEGILNYIEKKGLSLRPIASHSNFRRIVNMPRNLPDHLAKTLIEKKGIIGINFFRPFLGNNSLEGLLNHIQYALELNGENNLCFGADFFYDQDTPTFKESMNELLPFYSAPLENSSCYPIALEKISERFGEKIAKKIAFQNFENWLNP